MWPNRHLMDLLEIEHPLVLSPMAGIGTPELAAAVCEAGGLGSIGCGPMPAELVGRTIETVRGLTRRPISVNFFCHARATADARRERDWYDRLAPYYRELAIEQPSPAPAVDIAPFGEAQCAIVEALKPEVVSFHFGLPEPALLSRVKAAGCRVLSSATTVEEALWLEARGVDAVIAQGYEAGGHRATFLSSDIDRAMASHAGTLALVPQIVDVVRVPVIAAGGIADGRGIAAALALGAAAVQMGTAFLLCPETATPTLHRDALRRARGSKTVVTNLFTARPARVLPNRLTLEMGAMLPGLPDFPRAMGALGPLRAEAERRGSGDFTPMWAGQMAGCTREMPARALTLRLARDALARLRQLDGRMGGQPTQASGMPPARAS